MKTKLLLYLLLLPFLGFAQDKGATPLPAGASAKAGNTSSLRPKVTTRAVVIGISDYQDLKISDLQFADKDASAFAAWLQGPAGGTVPADNIKLLTNKAATTGAIAAAMDWLIADSKKGDQAIIYFSGHGDVETLTRFQRGFLLTYDSPPNNYKAGAFALIFLQDIISTLGGSEDMIRFVADRPGHDRRYAMDCSKALDELGWSPSASFDSALQQTLDWYRGRPEEEPAR